MTIQSDLPFLTDVEVSTRCFSYINQDSINAPMGDISFTLLPNNKLAGTMTMTILLGMPRKGTLTITRGEVDSSGLNYTFVAEGYLHQMGGKTTHIGPLDLTLVLDSSGDKGVLNGLMANTVATKITCSQ